MKWKDDAKAGESIAKPGEFTIAVRGLATPDPKASWTIFFGDSYITSGVCHGTFAVEAARNESASALKKIITDTIEDL